MSKYRGITYPEFLQFRIVEWFWKKYFCKHDMHLFDEVLAGDRHYLVCDACQLLVHIKSIDNRYCIFKNKDNNDTHSTETY